MTSSTASPTQRGVELHSSFHAYATRGQDYLSSMGVKRKALKALIQDMDLLVRSL
jgi:hypothetical protein